VKLAEPLRDLASKVEKEGQNGNLTTGELRIINYRVDLMIFLTDTSEKSLAALTQLGFEPTADSKAARILIGTLDVRKLENLARLDVVVAIKPVSPGR